MTLLERLKDIVPVRTRPGESHEQKMRREIAEDALMLNSLPLLLEIAEEAKAVYLIAKENDIHHIKLGNLLARLEAPHD